MIVVKVIIILFDKSIELFWIKCTDIDECLDNNGGCEQICSNAVGSFICGCRDGYNLSQDEYTCESESQ